MIIYLIIALIVITGLSTFGLMLYRLCRQPQEKLSWSMKCKLAISGVIAFIGDTLGIGSFAINVFMAKSLNTFKDEELPAANNGAQVLPGTIESVFFINAINVDIKTLVVLVCGACLGGLIGGHIVSHLRKQFIQLFMMVSFALIIMMLVAHEFHWLPSGGEANYLTSWKLVVAFIAMIASGVLTSAGVGLFVIVQGILFMLNVSPAVAFPIMTAAGALQQPTTTLVFLKNNRIPLKKTLFLSAFGCLGALIMLPLFSYIKVTWLHYLLLMILIYNLIVVTRNYLADKHVRAQAYAIA